MLIFILIGAVIGSWIDAGTVPALIYYGLEFASAQYFLPATLVICSLTSLVTGTSWGTVGTVGLALTGIGAGLDLPLPLVAGAVVSGAVFGDKISPISDTTNLAAASAETDLRSHIAAMLYTTVPAYLICLAIYAVLSQGHGADATLNTGQVDQIQAALHDRFDMHPVVMLPMLLLLTLMVAGVSAIPAMLAATFAGTLISFLFQSSSLGEALAAINYGYTEASGIATVDDILMRGGIQSMMWTFSLAYLALCLGGVLEKVGYLNVIVERIVQSIRSAANLVALVIGSSCTTNMLMGENYLSIILNGSMYRKAFDKAGLRRSMLSRTVEEGATQTAALVPWTTTGAFMAGTLGVATLSYAPYAFLNYINPLLSIVLAYLGVFILRVPPKTNGQPS